MAMAYEAIAGTATVELRILGKDGKFSPKLLKLNGCFVKRDANLNAFIDKSFIADNDKYESCKYLFYSYLVKEFQGSVTEAVIRYRKISKDKKSDKEKDLTLKNEPLVIRFNGHFFLCCDFKDICKFKHSAYPKKNPNDSKFLHDYSTVFKIRNLGSTVYGLGRENSCLRFFSLDVTQCQSEGSNIYRIRNDETRCIFDKLNESGPLLLRKDDKTKHLVGCYKKSIDDTGNCRIKIDMFEKSQASHAIDGGSSGDGTGQAEGTQSPTDGAGTGQQDGGLSEYETGQPTEYSLPAVSGVGTGQARGNPPPGAGVGTGQAQGNPPPGAGVGTGQARGNPPPGAGEGNGQARGNPPPGAGVGTGQARGNPPPAAGEGNGQARGNPPPGAGTGDGEAQGNPPPAAGEGNGRARGNPPPGAGTGDGQQTSQDQSKLTVNMNKGASEEQSKLILNKEKENDTLTLQLNQDQGNCFGEKSPIQETSESSKDFDPLQEIKATLPDGPHQIYDDLRLKKNQERYRRFLLHVARNDTGKWQEIGEKLEIKVNKLENLKADYKHEGSAEQAYQMLVHWRESDNKPTLEKLLLALNDTRLKQVAEQISGTDMLIDRRNRGGKAVTEQLLNKITNDVKDIWKFLGRYLAIDENDIYSIKMDNDGSTREQAHQMLVKWRQSNGRSATTGILVNALRDVGKTNVADYVRVWERQQQLS